MPGPICRLLKRAKNTYNKTTSKRRTLILKPKRWEFWQCQKCSPLIRHCGEGDLWPVLEQSGPLWYADFNREFHFLLCAVNKTIKTTQTEACMHAQTCFISSCTWVLNTVFEKMQHYVFKSIKESVCLFLTRQACVPGHSKGQSVCPWNKQEPILVFMKLNIFHSLSMRNLQGKR